MIVLFNSPLRMALRFSRNQILVYLCWAALIVVLFRFVGWDFLYIPFLPISLIGTALSFFLGFKNNASYDRLNEARKNYGAITNDSRAWAAMLNAYIDTKDEAKNEAIKTDLVNRHLAWLYAHKFYLRHKRQPWEPNTAFNNQYRELYQKEFSIDTNVEISLGRYIAKSEVEEVVAMANPATQLLNNQSQKLLALRKEGVIEDFRLFELQNHITKLIEHQGKNERIKNFPYPLQYSFMLRTSLQIFSLLLPFGLITELNKQGEGFIWLTIPFSVTINWIFYFMERNSDYSENPFQGLIYDVPITNITRNIEIDMLQMIGKKDLPQAISPQNGILM